MTRLHNSEATNDDLSVSSTTSGVSSFGHYVVNNPGLPLSPDSPSLRYANKRRGVPSYDVYVKSRTPPMNQHCEQTQSDYWRFLCYSQTGIALQMAITVAMILLTTFVIVYEFVKLRHHHRSPVWFIVLDVGIVVVLIVEIVLRFFTYDTSFTDWLRRGRNKFDFFVVVFSVCVLSLYFIESSTYADDAETAMFVARIVRDVIRIGRVVAFLHELTNSVVTFCEHTPLLAAATTPATADTMIEWDLNASASSPSPFQPKYGATTTTTAASVV